MGTFSKQAVDQAAKSYWSDYFKEYGTAFVRSIPLKVKAAVEKNAGLEQADGVLLPRAAALVSDGLTRLEGVYKHASGDALFSALVANDGSVSEVQTIAL
jgi:hypothetical protein